MTKKELGQRLKVLREFRKMTQAELASAVHCDVQTIYYYESGRSQPNIDRLSEIVKAMDFDITDLLTNCNIPIVAHDASEQPPEAKKRPATISDLARLEIKLDRMQSFLTRIEGDCDEIRDLLKRNASS